MASSPGADALVALIDDELGSFLADRADRLSEAEPMIEEICRIVRAGGKRIRPRFCYWGFRAAGRDHSEKAIRASAALELLHTFALVHDDIMDASHERRGVVTTHVKHDVPTALLVGDLALVLADELLAGSGFSAERFAAAFTVYCRMRSEVIAGQFLDLRSGVTDVDETKARRIAVLKSGRYSVMEPLLVGAALAGAPVAVSEALARFGEPLGEAFQLRDDVLGLFGDPSRTGKPVDSDIREGKRHLLYARTSALLAGAESDFFVARWGSDDATQEEIERLRALVQSSGAKGDVERLIDGLRSEAESYLEEAPIPPPAKRALFDLAALVIDRDR